MVLLASRTLTTAAAPKPSALGSTLGQDEGEGRLSLKKTDGAEHRLFVFLHVTALINTPFFTHSKKPKGAPPPKGKEDQGMVQLIYNCMNIITMSTAKPKRNNDSKLPPNYKVVFSVLKPNNQPHSIDRQQKTRITLSSPTRTAAGPFFTASKEKRPLIPYPASTKHAQTPQNVVPSRPLA